MKPYKDTFLNRNTRVRRFQQSVSSEELVWHRDRSDRVVKILEGSGWQLQMDNGLPEKLVEGKEYHIPANNYHRLIKGKTDLVAEIKEGKMKITRKQLRRIIKEQAPTQGPGTVWQEAMRIVAFEHQGILDTESQDSDWAITKMQADHVDSMAEHLCDWWTESSAFRDYPGDGDALMDALLDAGEMIIREAINEYDLSL